MTRLTMTFPLVLVLLLGCQSKLSTEHKFSLGPGEIQDVSIDAPMYAQKVVVTLSSDQPVDVTVHLKKDTKPLGSLKQSSSGTLEAQIPAKEEFVVTVAGATKQTKCSLKIAGQ